MEDLKTIKQIDRILQIWKEREIFGKDFIDKLQSFRPKGLRSESQSEGDQGDGSLLSPTKKRIRSTSDSGCYLLLYSYILSLNFLMLISSYTLSLILILYSTSEIPLIIVMMKITITLIM